MADTGYGGGWGSGWGGDSSSSNSGYGSGWGSSFGGGSSASSGGGYNYGGGDYGNVFGAGVGSQPIGNSPDSSYGSGWGDSFGSSDSFGLGGMDFGTGSFNYGSPAYSNPSMSIDAFSVPYSAPATPAWTGMTGLSMPEASATQAPSDGTAGFMDSDFVKGLRKFGLMAAKQNPTANKARGLLGAGEALGSGNYGQAAGTAVGLATGNGLLGGLASIGTDHFMNPTRTYAEAGPEGPKQVTVNADGRLAQTTGQRLAGMGMQAIGGVLGGAVGGPFGSMIGSDLAGRIAQKGATGPTPATTAGSGQGGTAPQQTKEGDWMGPLAGGLMSLYGLNQMKGTNKEQAAALAAQQAQLQALQQQIQAPAEGIRPPGAPAVRQPNFAAIQQQLAGMFGPKSGVATEMRSQLERKDAAAGRRSQYGPREVQLMSELTRLRAQAEPSYMNAEVAAANAANQASVGIYGSQMGAYNSQLQDRQANLQRLLAAQQLGMTNTTNQFTAQQAADTRRQQQLASLYSMGKDTGFFNWAGNTLGSYF